MEIGLGDVAGSGFYEVGGSGSIAGGENELTSGRVHLRRDVGLNGVSVGTHRITVEVSERDYVVLHGVVQTLGDNLTRCQFLLCVVEVEGSGIDYREIVEFLADLDYVTGLGEGNKHHIGIRSIQLDIIVFIGRIFFRPPVGIGIDHTVHIRIVDILLDRYLIGDRLTLGVPVKDTFGIGAHAEIVPGFLFLTAGEENLQLLTVGNGYGAVAYVEVFVGEYDSVGVLDAVNFLSLISSSCTACAGIYTLACVKVLVKNGTGSTVPVCNLSVFGRQYIICVQSRRRHTGRNRRWSW